MTDSHIVVGAPWSHVEAIQSGRVYAYERVGDDWVFAQEIHPKKTDRQARFGENLAMDGGRFVTSSRETEAVHVYRHDGSEWVAEALLSSDSSPKTSEPQMVDIHGGVVVVGEPLGNVATVFELTDAGWIETAVLHDPAPNHDDDFGAAVAVGEDLIVVGEPGGPCASIVGKIHAYERTGPPPGGWTLVHSTTASDGHGSKCGDHFGFSVDVHGHRILVGAPSARHPSGSGTSGAAYLFEKTEHGWTETTRLITEDLEKFDGLGWDVALGASFALVGGPFADNPTGVRAGEAYLYQMTLGGTVCEARASSTGGPATLEAQGLLLAEENVLELVAESLPPDTWGHFLAAPSHAITVPPGARSPLCLGHPLARLGGGELLSSGPQGVFRHHVDTEHVPLAGGAAIEPGETWYFQGWYRDQLGPTALNLTPAIAVEFR